MKNFSSIKIDDIKDKDLMEIVESLNKAVDELHIDFFLIGAQARNILLEENNITAYRLTEDYDFAVFINNDTMFDELKIFLINNFKFKAIDNITHRLLYADNKLVDILPFGDIALNEYMEFNDKEETIISIIGFKEIYSHMIEFGYDKDDFKITSLAGLTVLKLIAWSDKPYIRTKDIEDISIIMMNYFAIYQEEIFEDYPEWFDDDIDTLYYGARLLGKHIHRIIYSNIKLLNRILSILTQNSIDPENSPIAEIIYRRNRNMNLLSITQLLQQMIVGISD